MHRCLRLLEQIRGDCAERKPKECSERPSQPFSFEYKWIIAELCRQCGSQKIHDYSKTVMTRMAIAVTCRLRHDDCKGTPLSARAQAKGQRAVLQHCCRASHYQGSLANVLHCACVPQKREKRECWSPDTALRPKDLLEAVLGLQAGYCGANALQAAAEGWRPWSDVSSPTLMHRAHRSCTAL